MGWGKRKEPSYKKSESGMMGGTNQYRKIEYEWSVYGAGLDKAHEHFDDFPKDQEFCDLQAQLCPSSVVCYALRTCSWFEIPVSKTKSVEWATDGLEKLVMEDHTKRLLVGLVEQHRSNRDKGFSDIVENKGKVRNPSTREGYHGANFF